MSEPHAPQGHPYFASCLHAPQIKLARSLLCLSILFIVTHPAPNELLTSLPPSDFSPLSLAMSIACSALPLLIHLPFRLFPAVAAWFLAPRALISGPSFTCLIVIGPSSSVSGHVPHINDASPLTHFYPATASVYCCDISYVQTFAFFWLPVAAIFSYRSRRPLVSPPLFTMLVL